MAFDAYSSCPAGTGKKIKFCCPDLIADLEKIHRMIDGEQFIACLHHIDQLEQKGQHRACLMAIKSELLRVTDQLDAARTYVADFIRRFPEKSVAWAEAAILTAVSEGGLAAASKLHRSIALCQGTIQGRVYEAIGLVAGELIEEGRFLAGRALLHLLNVLNPEDHQALDRLLHFNSSAEIPLLLKADPGMMPCPADAPWRAEFEAAMEPMKRADWPETAERLAALTAKVPDAPVVWNNLARIRSWLADDAAVESLRHYAALGVPSEDAVEAEATAMLLSPSPLGDEVDVLRWSWPVRDAERLQELLLSDRRVMQLPVDLSAWPVGNSPPPRTAGMLLDRPALSGEESLSRDNLPRAECHLLLFGRETDRAARLEVLGLSRTQAERVTAILREIGGEALEAAPEETIVGKTSASHEMLMRRWVPPQGAPREQVDALLDADFRDTILNRWPDGPLGVFGGRSLRQTAADAATGDSLAQRKSLAAILVMQQWSDRSPDEFDFNDLRSSLGLPTLGPIDLEQCDLQRLPLVRLARVQVAQLDDQKLSFAFHRAVMYHISDAARTFAQAVIAREGFASRPDRVEAYRVLVEMAENFEESLKCIEEARGQSLAAGQSCAIWDLMELSVRFGQGDVHEAMRLMQHIESRHMKEPGVAQSLTRMLINAGLLNPDGTPVAVPPGYPGGESVPADPEPSKLWTPGSESSGSGGGKLWTPGS